MTSKHDKNIGDPLAPAACGHQGGHFFLPRYEVIVWKQCSAKCYLFVK